MSETVILRDVRYTWLDVLTQNKKFGNYRAECLLDLDGPEDKKLQEAIHKAAVEKWGEAKAANYLKAARANKKVCRKLGDDMNPDKNTGEVPEHYIGKAVLSAARREDRDGPPAVYCAKVDEPTRLVRVDKDSDLTGLIHPVGGNFGDVIVNVWAFEYDGAPQVNCTLETITFRRKGDSLRSRTSLSVDQLAEALGAQIDEGVF